MKVNDFLEKLKHIEKLPTTYYSVAGGSWGMWNGASWNFDCVILIKAILWGWCENKNHSHGGAIYGSNGVYDDTADSIINRCLDVSSNFSKIEKGELVWLDGHVGVYIGDGKVIECTGAWERKVLISNIDEYGRRTKNGYQVYSWKLHGKLPYIDYSSNKETSEKPLKAETTYIVKAGDVLWKIAEMFGTTAGELARINKLENPDLIYIGQKIIINEGKKDKETYIVQKGDTLWKIANKYNMSVQKLYDDNKSVIGDNPDLIEIGMELVIK